MAGMIFFGTRRRMVWVKPFQTEPDFKKSGWNVQTKLLNGGGYNRRSAASARSYVLTWNPMHRDDLRPITDYADYVYGDANDLIYWLDPMAIDRNLLNQTWATPYLACSDAMPMIYGSKPRVVVNSDLSRGYPAFGAQYTLTATSRIRKTWVPVPAGYTAWVGVHASAAAQNYVAIQPTLGYENSGAPIVPVILGVSEATRVNTAISAGTRANFGIELQLYNANIVGAATRTFTLYGLIVQVLPDGVEPTEGDFISGQGHSGCEFREAPSETPYGSYHQQTGMVATLDETGDWK